MSLPVVGAFICTYRFFLCSSYSQSDCVAALWTRHTICTQLIKRDKQVHLEAAGCCIISPDKKCLGTSSVKWFYQTDSEEITGSVWLRGVLLTLAEIAPYRCTNKCIIALCNEKSKVLLSTFTFSGLSSYPYKGIILKNACIWWTQQLTGKVRPRL